MNAKYDQEIKSRHLSRISAVASLAVALCSGGTALAENNDGHHEASQSQHKSSHSDFSYNYTEMRYLDVTVDEAGVDLGGDGFEIEGSVAVGDKYHAYALYEKIGFDHSIDLDEWAVGFGTHFSIAPGADFLAQIGYISEEVSEPAHATHSDDGYVLGIGVRKKVGDGGEILVAVDFTDLSDAGSITSFELAGEVHVTQNLALGLGVNVSDEATAYFAEARLYFGSH